MQTHRSTPWLFLTPNLVIFGVFTFLPIVINFYYAFTGGVQLYPQDRPYVGLENLATLLDCGSWYVAGFGSCESGVYSPEASAADAVTSLKVEPGGFRSPAMARLDRGMPGSATSSS